MDALVQGYSKSMSDFKFNRHANLNGNGHDNMYGLARPVREFSAGGDLSEERDNSDAILKYISQMLLEEEDLEHRPCMFHDCSALQAAEKSLYDVIGEKYPPSLDQTPDCSSSPVESSNSLETEWIGHRSDSISSFLNSSVLSHPLEANLKSFSPSTRLVDSVNGLCDPLSNAFQILDTPSEPEVDGGTHLEPGENCSGTKKNHHREDNDLMENERSSKQLASYGEESEPTEIYDKVLLCATLNPHLHDEPTSYSGIEAIRNASMQNEQGKSSNRGSKRRANKKQSTKKEVVDLRSLLTQCAQAVSIFDSRTANELLKRIRQHSSPFGDGTARLAHYFADALEARLAGNGTTMYMAFKARRTTAADVLKAYQVFISACPFKKMSNVFANRSIGKLAQNSTRLHIIDFGILYGFQWPCVIQSLSMRPGGPPKLRITGIELPQPGPRPAERVEATGNRLANYCQRFNVPFEYNAIAKKWDAIQLEDLKIEWDETLVVNCLYRMENVPDETVVSSSPRDAVLNLVKRINPDLFLHGVVNGTYNAPFFVTRFREALFHFSAQFDMFEATIPCENQERLLFEKEIIGRDAMNVIACEGTERVERPETYKQWQVRVRRAGFRQLPLDREIMEHVRGRVLSRYHKDFSVDEESNWMLHGWKGRVLYALSCWKPVHNS